MPPQTSLVNRLKVQLKLSISRLRMTQQKDAAKAKQQRREMAQLIEAGKLQSARIRVENIIRSDITTELHEILELYCELLLARSQLLDPPSSPLGGASGVHAIPLDPALEEAVRSIIYAAARTEVKELHTTRVLLVEKFGKDIALASMEGEGVAERVLKKLKVETPKPELVDAYLSEIARFYGVPYGENKAEEGEEDDIVVDDDDDEPSGGIAEEADNQKESEPALETTTATGKNKKVKADDEREELVKATPPKKLGPQSPLRITPPSPSTDNIAPKLRLPGNVAAKAKAAEAKKAPVKKEDGPGGKIPDVDELAKRFAQLKR